MRLAAAQAAPGHAAEKVAEHLLNLLNNENKQAAAQ